jgi:2-iminobutanoate/2-iminopropanoate deaminase
MSTISSLNTNKAPKAIGPYSQAVSDGNYLFVSGQLPMNPESGKIEAEDTVGQGKQVLANLRAVLAEAGLDFTNVLRVDVFLKDLNDFKDLNSFYEECFGHQHPPARQTVEVARLPMDAKIEISCIARL